MKFLNNSFYLLLGLIILRLLGVMNFLQLVVDMGSFSGNWEFNYAITGLYLLYIARLYSYY